MFKFPDRKEDHMTDALNSLKNLLTSQELFACIIPNTDPHQSEYIADYWRTMRFLTGFSGSTGNIVISQDFAGVWTDSRYFIQAEKQLEGSGFELVKLTIPHTPEYIDWLLEKAPEGSKIGLDARLFSVSLYRKMEARFSEKTIEIIDLGDFITDLWPDRPPVPLSPIFLHDISFAGKSRKQKLREIRQDMKSRNLSHTFISSLDDIAWLYNIRGSDVSFNPTPLCYTLVGLTHAWLFIHPSKVSEEIRLELKGDLILKGYDEVETVISQLESDSRIFLDPGKSNFSILQSLPDSIALQEGMNLTSLPKALKNETEIGHIRASMVKDGVAMVRFLIWLQDNIGKIKITEVSASEQLEAFRAEQDHFIGPSFSTIAGYQGNGAIVHYSAEAETCAELEATGIFLLDSGGQYLSGTTDITRTLSLGEPTSEQKRDFTLVLKGHIAIADLVFPAGTRGFQLESHARKALWKNGLNYGHGTGHGVGFFLNVHEGPQTMGTGANGAYDTPLMPGMLTSNEPGVYHNGKYGIRIENLILCIEDQETAFGQFLKFETLSLCPIDVSLIENKLLSPEERNWLNQYHRKVHQELAPHLSPAERIWLEAKTQAL